MNAEKSLKLARRFIELPLEKRRLFLDGLRGEGIDFSQFPIPADVPQHDRDALSYAQLVTGIEGCETSLLPELEGFLELAEYTRMTGESQSMHALSPEGARDEFELGSQVLDMPVANIDSAEVRVPARDGFSLSARL